MNIEQSIKKTMQLVGDFSVLINHPTDLSRGFQELSDAIIYQLSNGNIDENGKNAALFKMHQTANLVNDFIAEASPFFQKGIDYIGRLYEHLNIYAAAGKTGQHFTPQEIADIMAGFFPIQSNNIYTIADASGCGSSNLMLGKLRQVVDNGGKAVFYGADLDLISCKMSLIAFAISGYPAIIRFGNALKLNSALAVFRAGKRNEKPFIEVLNNEEMQEFAQAEISNQIAEYCANFASGIYVQEFKQQQGFDCIVSNPPFSAKWEPQTDARFAAPFTKLAPASKADFAFLQHLFYMLHQNGNMCAVLPHGVLFRGAGEAAIRKAFVEDLNALDAVIGLPENIFQGTSIPTCILVFRKNRAPNEKILFVDASNDFDKGKTINTIKPQHIKKLVDTFKNRLEIEKYSRLIGLKEIQANDYNLNIPRYIDNFEQEEQIDLLDTFRQIQELDKALEQNAKELNQYLKQLNLPIFELTNQPPIIKKKPNQPPPNFPQLF